MLTCSAAFVLTAVLSVSAAPADTGNRLVYLDAFCNPYYVGLATPKLTTPQWIGEDGVEAVIVFAIDDMRDPKPYETYLRPILNRLKSIDGRAPVSIMTVHVDPQDPQLQTWLQEGVRVEAHTYDHPCPCLQGNDFDQAKTTFDRTIDLLTGIPNHRPVAFRMPCCDSMNSVSPRFFTEIFNKTTPAGNFLRMDSSIFLLFTPNDPNLPRDWLYEPDGRLRFNKHIPQDRDFVNWVKDYPYPYVIARRVWEMPSAIPDDWQGFHLNGAHHPGTVADMIAAIDATVLRKGVFTLTFHPGRWIRNDQVVAMIDHVTKSYGRKVKFLNLHDVRERLSKHLLDGQTLRAANGEDNGVRLLDVNNDGFMDVVIGNEHVRKTRIWSPETRTWIVTSFPVAIVDPDTPATGRDAGVRFGVLQKNGNASLMVHNEHVAGLWHFEGTEWRKQPNGLAGLDLPKPLLTSVAGVDQGVRLRDLDQDGVCELIVGNGKQPRVFGWSAKRQRWQPLSYALPSGTTIVDGNGRDAGLRFVDVDEDGFFDVVFSNASQYSVHLFAPPDQGWTRRVLSGQQGDEHALPPIVRADGTNNGVWFKDRHLWLQNEETGKRAPNHVEHRSFTNDLLGAEKEPPPRSPAASLKSMQPRPGFQVELMASEPLVMDPIDIAWGPDGKAWVAEMADYPLGLDNQGQPGGRIRFLEDTDGDGRYDKSTVFLEPIGFPSGVMPWRKGVIVTAAPSVFYAEDTDGDGRADIRKTLLCGFHEGNQQHRVNHPRWSLDNWVSLANGDSDGTIQSLLTGQVVDIGGRDLRFRPDDGSLDTQTGRTQFGRNRDDWGNWFGCNNNNPGWHYVLKDHYIRRNPHIAAPPGRLNLTQYRDVYPAGRVMTHCFMDQPTPAEGIPGRWTAVASVMVYRDNLFGPNFAGNLFEEDSVYNVVHRLVLQADGVRIRGERAPDEERTEFLGSADPWFRPTTVRTGPDGALWIADMYRYVIEHPQWIDDELEMTLDLRRGHDRGRLWRIVPVGKKPRPIPRLDRLNTAQLVAALDSSNGWQRDMAQQMLLWRNDPAAVKPLASMAQSHPRALARLHALCTLDGLNALQPNLLLDALDDEHPGVRRHAIRLTEAQVNDHPALGEALLQRLDDPDPFVQLQLAYSLGEWTDPRAGRALGRLAVSHADDPYLLAAVLSSAMPHVAEMIAEVRKKSDQPELLARLTRLQKDIASHPKTNKNTAVSQPVAVSGSGSGPIARRTSPERQAALDAFAPVLPMKGDPVQGRQVFVEATCAVCHRFEDVGQNLGPDIKTLVDRSPRNLLAAIIDPNQAVKERFVPYTAVTTQGLTHSGLLLDQTSNSITLADSKGKTTVLLRRDLELLVRMNQSFMPEGLEKVLDLQKMADLLAFLGKAGAPRRRIPGNQPKTVLAAAEGFLELTADQVEIYGDAISFDQQLHAISSWTNTEDYVVWSLHLQRGRTFDVWIESACPETTAGHPFVVDAGAGTITGNIPATASWKTFRWTKLGQLRLSSGIHRIGFRADGPISEPLVNLRTVKLTLPGKSPEGPTGATVVAKSQKTVEPDADGVIQLSAIAGKAVGPNIKFMPKWQAYGWFMAKDHIEWVAHVSHDAVYDAWLEWAVENKYAGKPWVFQIGDRNATDQRLLGAVGKTGSWETYRKVKIGRIRLPAGTHSASLRAGSSFQGPLFDFRAITLVPIRHKNSMSSK